MSRCRDCDFIGYTGKLKRKGSEILTFYTMHSKIIKISLNRKRFLSTQYFTDGCRMFVNVYVKLIVHTYDIISLNV